MLYDTPIDVLRDRAGRLVVVGQPDSARRASATAWQTGLSLGTSSRTSGSCSSYHFMLNALRAGTIVAVLAGAIGYFMVLRRQILRRAHAGGGRLPRCGRRHLARASTRCSATSASASAGALVIAALPGGGRATGTAGAARSRR